jgi:hypothetical protein
MKILKERVDNLAIRVAEEEKQAQVRREELMTRLIRSRNNNLKLFNLKIKGDDIC